MTHGGKCITNGVYNNLENCTFGIDVPDPTVLIVERMSVEFSYDILVCAVLTNVCVRRLLSC